MEQLSAYGRQQDLSLVVISENFLSFCKKEEGLREAFEADWLQRLEGSDDATAKIIGDLQETVQTESMENQKRIRTLIESVAQIDAFCKALREEVAQLNKAHEAEKMASRKEMEDLRIENRVLIERVTKLELLIARIGPVEEGVKKIGEDLESEKRLRWGDRRIADKKLEESLVPLREIARGANDTAVQALTLSLANEKTSLGLEMKLVTLSTNMAEKEEEIKRLNASLQENERRLQIAQQTATQASATATAAAARAAAPSRNMEDMWSGRP